MRGIMSQYLKHENELFDASDTCCFKGTGVKNAFCVDILNNQLLLKLDKPVKSTRIFRIAGSCPSDIIHADYNSADASPWQPSFHQV
ncbi:hypothetical protein CEXT_147401 [Caerostris extrusa]|uniref:Uncharacterized protein n=1 Tax=Caerostris extrusa TaxID=172846 RepID=A0AAV4M6I6_CAEEX|nr:hypothetical protein CEXT_147401 [Caerostris extrusa]